MKKLILLLMGVGMISFSATAQTSRTSRTRTTTMQTNTTNRTGTTGTTGTMTTTTTQPTTTTVQPVRLDTAVNRNSMYNNNMSTDPNRNRISYPNTPTNTLSPTRSTNYNNTTQPRGTNGLPASPGNMNGTDFNNPNGNTNPGSNNPAGTNYNGSIPNNPR